MTQPTDPSWDPATKARVRHAYDQFLFEIRDIVRRRADSDGFYTPPGDIAEFGDVTGLLQVGANQLSRPVEAALEKMRTEMLAVWNEVDEYKRQQVGPNYHPPERRV